MLVGPRDVRMGMVDIPKIRIRGHRAPSTEFLGTSLPLCRSRGRGRGRMPVTPEAIEGRKKAGANRSLPPGSQSLWV